MNLHPTLRSFAPLTLTALARVANHDRAQPTALNPIVSARDRARLDGLRLRIGRTFQ